MLQPVISATARGIWRAPERLFDEPDELVIWARAALAAARRVAAKRERAARKRKSKSQL
jgi:DNA transformation protein